MEPIDYAIMYSDDKCQAYEPDYTQYDECVDQIDYDQVNADLNTKLEAYIRSKGVSDDYEYQPFASNASIYCDTVFNDAVLAESKILCYE